jgi:chemotaxis protein methyltransferase CheR
MVEALPQSSLILDADLRIVVASNSFYATFEKVKENTQDKLIYQIGSNQYDVPALRHFLNNIIPYATVMKEFKVVYDSLTCGRREVLLSARETSYENSKKKYIFVTIDEVNPPRRI